MVLSLKPITAIERTFLALHVVGANRQKGAEALRGDWT